MAPAVVVARDCAERLTILALPSADRRLIIEGEPPRQGEGINVEHGLGELDHGTTLERAAIATWPDLPRLLRHDNAQGFRPPFRSISSFKRSSSPEA